MRFAKVFDVEDEQLLVYIEEDEDFAIVHNVTDTPEARIDTKVQFKRLEDAQKYLESITCENAEKLIIEMADFLNN